MICRYLSLMLAMGGSAAVACNIPVFRYALERWTPDAAELVVVHDGAFSESAQSQVNAFRKLLADSHGRPAVNLKLDVVDWSLPTTDGDVFDTVTARLLAAQPRPHAVLRIPMGRGKYRVVWSGSVNDLQSAPLLDSPARRELTSRLTTGDAVVWLVVTSGHPERDETVRSMLEEQFEKLAETIPFPEGIGEPGSELYSDIPLLMKFSVLEVDRSDPREALLISLLTDTVAGQEQRSEPLVVPVFGRGRALEVIPADELSPGLVRDLTQFLCGACSCQVKDLNPGFDLLLKQDWDTSLFGEDAVSPALPDPQPGPRSKEPILIPIPAGRSSGGSR